MIENRAEGHLALLEILSKSYILGLVPVFLYLIYKVSLFAYVISSAGFQA